jgi:excisionase family DNA binding protein
MITINELAEAVGVSPHTAHNWLARRPHLGVKVGGRRLVPRSAVRAYRESQAANRAKPLEAVPDCLRRAIQRQTRKSGGCRLWTGPCGHDGLPRVVITQSLPVGRYAYVARFGALRAGERVGPTCGNSACIEHLKVREDRVGSK